MNNIPKLRSIHRLHDFYSHSKGTNDPIKGTDTGRDDAIFDLEICDLVV